MSHWPGSRHDRQERELDAELRDHVERHVSAQVAAGVPEREARRRTRLEVGGLDQLKERCRELRPSRWLDEIGQDVRYAVRSLLAQRSFTGVALLALALGIGINTAMLTIYVAHAVRGLPIDAPDRVGWLSTRDARARGAGLSLPDFRDARDTLTSFTTLVAFQSGPVVVGNDGEPPGRFQAAFTSAGTFELIGETPLLGRRFDVPDARPDAAPVVILGGGLWRSRYGGDPNIIGRTIEVDGRPATVVGVMPDRLRFPGNADLWRPLAAIPDQAGWSRTLRTLSVFGRLGDGVSMEQAATEVAALARAWPSGCPAPTGTSRSWPNRSMTVSTTTRRRGTSSPTPNQQPAVARTSSRETGISR